MIFTVFIGEDRDNLQTFSTEPFEHPNIIPEVIEPFMKMDNVFGYGLFDVSRNGLVITVAKINDETASMLIKYPVNGSVSLLPLTPGDFATQVATFNLYNVRTGFGRLPSESVSSAIASAYRTALYVIQKTVKPMTGEE